jgi:hypothetical protein
MYARRFLLPPSAGLVQRVLLALLLAGPAHALALTDADKDGLPDVLDNCTLVPNPGQADLDNDGYGNACDADINNDGKVDDLDLKILQANLGQKGALGDLNGDGIVDEQDLAILRAAYGQRPGPTGLGRNPPTTNGRNPPSASNVQMYRFTEALPDGRNAIVLADFGAFFASDRGVPPPPAVVVFNNGDAATLLREGLTPADLGQPNALGARAGELVVLNDVGLFGDDKAADGIYSGLLRADAALMEAEAGRFLERVRSKQAFRGIAFNEREAAGSFSFDPADAFEKPAPQRRFTLALPEQAPVTLVAVPFPKLKLLLPPSTDADHTLLINALGVVQDPGRTFSPCNNAGAFVPTGNVNGVWSFKTLMTHMANGVPVQTFVNEWLRQWLAVANNVPHDDGVAVPSFPVPARPALLAAIQTIQPGWNPANPATLNLNRLPFRLLAIVNRIDLAQTSYIGSGSPGELRFVFGLLERNPVTGQCVPANEMTVILEYKVPTTTCTGLKMLANQWIVLDGLAPGTAAFNAVLQSLTLPVTTPNAWPGRINGSAIGQVRTNEARLGPLGGGLPWEMREFTLQTHPAFAPLGTLRHETVKNTPDALHNNTALLSDWIANHAGEAIPRQHGGVDFIATANRYGPGAVPFNPPWNGSPQNSTSKRFRMSSNTCGGCHLNETGTGFTMVKGNGPLGAPAALAGFLTGINNVPDAAYGPPPLPGAFRSFNDLFRRGQILDQLAAKSCMLFPELSLMQAPALFETPVDPESIFNPKFVH